MAPKQQGLILLVSKDSEGRHTNRSFSINSLRIECSPGFQLLLGCLLVLVNSPTHTQKTERHNVLLELRCWMDRRWFLLEPYTAQRSLQLTVDRTQKRKHLSLFFSTHIIKCSFFISEVSSQWNIPPEIFSNLLNNANAELLKSVRENQIQMFSFCTKAHSMLQSSED